MSTQLDILNWRYATKKFEPSAIIPTDEWADLEEAFRLCPSSLGLQLWKFIVVSDKELREQLSTASFGQTQVRDASHYVVLCARRDVDDQDITDYINLQREIRGISEEAAAAASAKYANYSFFWKDEADAKAYLESQIHLASGFLAHTAASMSIDSCFIGGIIPAEYDRILNLEESRYHAVLGMAFGYRSAEDTHAQDPKVRYPASRVIEHR